MSSFAGGVFGLKTRLFQRGVRSAAQGMRLSENLDLEALRAVQRRRALKLASFAYESSPFYREFYQSVGLSTRDLEDPDVFEHLPIVEKSQIRERAEEFRVHDSPKSGALASSTGGSTGEPLQVFHDKRAPVAAMWWRAYRWWGISPADNSAYIYRQSRTGLREAAHFAEWWPTRQILLNARGMTNESMARFAVRMRRVRPLLLNGYVDGVHEFARFVAEQGVDLPQLKAIAVTASPLLEPKRLAIEDLLRAPVYDCYRTAEVPWIAAQCRIRDGLHVQADIRVVECVDNGGSAVAPGQSGEVVVTDLCNRVFPLVRYRLGDRSAVRLQPCSCGMSLPLIDPVRGRVVDVLRTPGGRVVAGGLSVVFNRWPRAIRQFQIRQASDYHVRLVCVPGDSLDVARAAMAVVAGDLRTMLDNAVSVTAVEVTEIPHDGGKIRLVVSELS